MQSQLINDDSPSPTPQFILQYTVNPDIVYVSSDSEEMLVNLTIAVFNPTSAAVNCQSFQFGIYIGTAEEQLAPTSVGIQLTTEQSQWSTNAEPETQGNLYWYTAVPASGVASEPLASGDTFIFRLENISVNNVEGVSQFMIFEATDGDPDGVQGALPLTKEQGSLAIEYFNVTPPTPVAPGAEVNLSWKVNAAEYWQLYNTLLSELLYDSRQHPQPQMNWTATPDEQTEYELFAYAGQFVAVRSAVAQVANPRFVDDFPPTANPGSVDSGTASVISWKTADTQYVIVTAAEYTSGQVDSSSGSGELQVNPQLTTTYEVTTYSADGQSGEALNVTVSVNPPLIKIFNATPQSFAPGQPVTLSWETESVTELVLNPGGESLPITPPSYVVYPKGQVVYQLTAYGEEPSFESGPVTVTQQLETFQAGEVPQALAYDGTYLWIANAYANTVTRLLLADGSSQGSFPCGVSPSSLAYDGTYLWVANGGVNQVTRLLAADGSNQGTFTVGNYARAVVYADPYIWVANFQDNTVSRLLTADGSNHGTFPVGNTPQALAYDGTCIWVGSCFDSNTVTRILAADGSNQGSFTAGYNPQSLAYDGTHIWVVNSQDNTLTRLLATDGSNQGTFPVGHSPLGIAYDGTCIWTANSSDNTVTRLLVTDGSNQGTFQVGNYPYTLTYDGTYIWVANYGDNTVTRIRPSDWPPSSERGTSMQSQSLNDDSPTPPAQFILQYKLDPNTVYVSSDEEPMLVDLTITVYNPTSETVNCENFQFGIYVGTTESRQLASSSDGIQLTTAQSQWVTNAAPAEQGDLYWYTAEPAQGAASEPLAAGESFVFQLIDVLVNQIQGQTPFMILEMTGADPDGVQGSRSLTKEAGTLTITKFTVIPPTPIAPGTQINLSWGVVEAEYWLLYNTTLTKLLYDSRQHSSPQTNWSDTPEAWTEYELIVYAGQIFTFATAVAQVSNPRFVDPLPAAKPQTVDSGAAATLSWTTADAQYVIVTAEGYTSGHIDSSSGKGSCTVNPIVATLYTLTPYSAEGASGGANNVQVYVSPPAITSFTATAEAFQPGQPVILAWATESITSLVLEPGGVTVPLNSTSYPVHPTGEVVYQLTGQQGEGASTKSAPITVTQLLETFPVGPTPEGLAYDGTYIWVANSGANNLTRLRASDGSNQGTFPVESYPQALIYFGGYIWAANGSQPTITRLRAADGSNQGTFPCSDFASGFAHDGTYIWLAVGTPQLLIRLLATDGSNQGSFKVGSFPHSLTYDGKYIWVCNTSDNTVNRLLATDGSNQGTFPTGRFPIALAFDGTYIWVANMEETFVSRLLAADGSNHGTFPTGTSPYSLAYDGTYVWVAENSENTITRLLAADGSNHGSFRVGVSPAALVYDGTYVWVANSNDNTVTRIRPSDWPTS
ncbi:MAG: hypothetical protein QOD75_1888 [Blastocatellia bacterium]|jgi:hypothetical protein|nr:hypothetical protein [Blastocatellia bacterium]